MNMKDAPLLETWNTLAYAQKSEADSPNLDRFDIERTLRSSVKSIVEVEWMPIN